MTAFLSALALALATYLFATRHMLPSRRVPEESPRRRRAAKTTTQAWSATQRAMTLLGWTPRRLRMTSMICAGGSALLWMLLVQDALAALIMGLVGWQLPALWLEKRATSGMMQLHRQFAELVSFVHDQLHSRGATVETAMLSAAKTFTAEPLAEMLRGYDAATASGLSLSERLASLRKALDLPTADFFFQLLLLRAQSGTEDMSHAFDSLDDKLQDDEQMQAMIQGELRMHSLLLMAGFLVNLVVFPAYRLDGADWPAIHAHLSIIVTGSALLTLFIFSGIRRFTKMQLNTGSLA